MSTAQERKRVLRRHKQQPHLEERSEEKEEQKMPNLLFFCLFIYL